MIERCINVSRPIWYSIYGNHLVVLKLSFYLFDIKLRTNQFVIKFLVFLNEFNLFVNLLCTAYVYCLCLQCYLS